MAEMNAEGNLDLDTVTEHEKFSTYLRHGTHIQMRQHHYPPPPLSIIHIKFCFSLINLWRGFD